MAYATIAECSKDGAIIYGEGNFRVKSHAKGFIYWPTRISPAVAMDAAIDPATATESEIAKLLQRKHPVGKDADILVRLLLPTLKRIASEAETEATDNAEEEADDLGMTGEDSADESAESNMVSLFANDFYKAERERWASVNRNNTQRRGQGFAPVAANASKGH